MASILDAFPYPFDKAVGRELHLSLCELYPASQPALFAAQKTGLSIYTLNGNQPPYFVWKDILEAAATAQLTRILVETALADFPRSPRRQFLQALLAGDTPPSNHDGSTKFRKKADTLTEQEALLYHDDLTLPIGRLPALIEALEILKTLAPAICKMEVSAPGKRGWGTGFRISDGWLLTNQHVLYLEGSAPTAITATFGFDDDGMGGGPAGTAIKCDQDSAKADANDDWGIVRMRQSPGATIPVLGLENSAVPELNSGAFVIQHPAGDRKRIAYARNQITYVDQEVVHYLSDTQTGSSGSPVFDGQGRLIALHRVGGCPQEIAGQTPIRKNEGVRIDWVRQGIAALHINLD